MQVCPFAFLGVHFPALQKLVPVQGAVSEQPPAQMAAAHVLGAQLTVSIAGHAPFPSQPAATVATALAQLPARQDWLLPGNVQALRFAPSQVPAHGAAPAHAVRPARGAPVTARQIPFLLASAQDSHCPAHAVSQQTPSTQKPLGQSPALLQALPRPAPAVPAVPATFMLPPIPALPPLPPLAALSGASVLAASPGSELPPLPPMLETPALPPCPDPVRPALPPVPLPYRPRSLPLPAPPSGTPEGGVV